MKNIYSTGMQLQYQFCTVYSKITIQIENSKGNLTKRSKEVDCIKSIVIYVLTLNTALDFTLSLIIHGPHGVDLSPSNLARTASHAFIFIKLK